jgi:hypothetical protein
LEKREIVEIASPLLLLLLPLLSFLSFKYPFRRCRRSFVFPESHLQNGEKRKVGIGIAPSKKRGGERVSNNLTRSALFHGTAQGYNLATNHIGGKELKENELNYSLYHILSGLDKI